MQRLRIIIVYVEITIPLQRLVQILSKWLECALNML